MPPASRIAALSWRFARLRATAPLFFFATTRPYLPGAESSRFNMWITTSGVVKIFPFRMTRANSAADLKVLSMDRSSAT
jgi:hypothetical protein